MFSWPLDTHTTTEIFTGRFFCCCCYMHQITCRSATCVPGLFAILTLSQIFVRDWLSCSAPANNGRLFPGRQFSVRRSRVPVAVENDTPSPSPAYAQSGLSDRPRRSAKPRARRRQETRDMRRWHHLEPSRETFNGPEDGGKAEEKKNKKKKKKRPHRRVVCGVLP